ncbi:DUF4397 domain-containing protein [candidate division GN15 bacterium]|nr:DUF4397 domain-containing protein [candidate division GN15 bacterium]
MRNAPKRRTIMRSNLWKLMSMALVVPLLVLAGCSDDDDDVIGPTAGNASVRVIHTSYDAPAVDVLVDNATPAAIDSLPYGGSSGYAEITSGSRNFKVVANGTTTPAVIDTTVGLTEGTSYTVFAMDELSMIGPVITADDRAPDAANAKIRFVHASPDAPAVDIKLNTGSGPAVFTNASFKDITAYQTVAGGSYSFAVTATGATDEVVVFDPVTVANGSVYTVVAHGTLDAGDAYPFAVRVFVDNGAGDQFVDLTAAGTSEVMVVHASPDAPGVDLLIDDVVTNSAALSFPNNTPYLTLADGSRNVKVNASGTSTTVIDADLSLVDGNAYTVFAIDSLASIEPLLLTDDLTAPASGNAHVRFVHLSPDAPAVDITLTDGTVIFGDYSFRQSSNFTPLAAQTVTLEVRLQGTSTVVLTVPNVTLQDGKIYTVWASGFVANLAAQIIENN